MILAADDARARSIRERAYILADTGRFEGWRQVSLAMAGEGWTGSREVLDRDFMRMALNERCAAARAPAHQ